MSIRHVTLLAAAAMAVAGCSDKPDPSRQFELGLDGGRYLWQPGPAVAFVTGFEYGGGYQANGIQVIFPMQRSTVRPIPGLDIIIRPDLPLGTEIAFGDTGRAVTVSFRPSSAIPLPEGTFIGWGSDYAGGAGTMVLEACDARPGGRITGTIRHAKLRSLVYDQLKGDVVPSAKASYLELWNWPFDLPLAESPYD